MSVRQSLLAILDQGACYGYQLRAEFDRRTGSTWPLNVGQIYNTLDRLERDGLVAKGDVDEQGHVYWRITDAGSADVRAWLGAPVERTGGTRDELAIKLAVAATLPGVDVDAVIEAQRVESRRRLAELAPNEPESDAGGGAREPDDLVHEVIVDSLRFAVEAELRWLDRVQERVAAHPRHALAVGLSTERPRRGRPAKAGAVA